MFDNIVDDIIDFFKILLGTFFSVIKTALGMLPVFFKEFKRLRK